ncbi:hypothetical protein [Helicobacter sp. 23-1045]
MSFIDGNFFCGNLFWGMRFRTCEKFWDFADSKSSLNPKNFHKYKSHTAITSMVASLRSQILRIVIALSQIKLQNFCHIERSEKSQILPLPCEFYTPPQTPPTRGWAFSFLPLPCGGGLRGWVDSTKSTNCHTERSEVSQKNIRDFSLITFAQNDNVESDSANLSPNPTSKSLIFSQKGCTPLPAPPTRQKLPLFAFRGRASLNPLLAKNRRLHYCNLAPDFLHHEAGEIKGASHESFLDSANAESKTTHPLAPSAREGGFLDCHDLTLANLAMAKFGTLDSAIHANFSQFAKIPRTDKK